MHTRAVQQKPKFLPLIIVASCILLLALWFFGRSQQSIAPTQQTAAEPAVPKAPTAVADRTPIENKPKKKTAHAKAAKEPKAATHHAVTIQDEVEQTDQANKVLLDAILRAKANPRSSTTKELLDLIKAGVLTVNQPLKFMRTEFGEIDIAYYYTALFIAIKEPFHKYDLDNVLALIDLGAEAGISAPWERAFATRPLDRYLLHESHGVIPANLDLVAVMNWSFISKNPPLTGYLSEKTGTRLTISEAEIASVINEFKKSPSTGGKLQIQYLVDHGHIKKEDVDRALNDLIQTPTATTNQI